MTILNSYYFCPECNNGVILNKIKGETICRNCGLVIEQNLIDFRDEQREFDKNSEYMHYEIREKNDTYIKNTLALYPTFDRRLIKLNNQKTGKEQSEELNEVILKKFFKQFKLRKNIKRTSKHILNLFLKLNKRIHKREVFIATIVFISCRMHNYPIMLAEIKDFINITPSEVFKEYTKLQKLFNIHIKPMNAIHYLPLFVNLIDKQYLNEVKSILISLPSPSKNPRVICGAVLDHVAKKYNLSLTQKKICNILKITTIPVRELKEELFK